MNYPEGYTDKDKEDYDIFHRFKVKEHGNNPTEYELFHIDIFCKQYVCSKKGYEYEPSQYEMDKIAEIWETYGQYLWKKE